MFNQSDFPLGRNHANRFHGSVVHQSCYPSPGLPRPRPARTAAEGPASISEKPSEETKISGQGDEWSVISELVVSELVIGRSGADFKICMVVHFKDASFQPRSGVRE